MAGGDGAFGTGTSPVPCPPVVAGGGNAGDTVTVVVEVPVALDVVAEVGGVVVVSEPESSPPHATSKPAATPAASANRAELESMRRGSMSPLVTRRDDS
jgi:hypothetical protein